MAKVRQDFVFSLLEQAAAAGERCPTNIQLASLLKRGGFGRAAASSMPQIVGSLVKQGLVVVRIYGRNYRDVLICSGEQRGLATRSPPHGGVPYVILDVKGRRVVAKPGTGTTERSA